MDVAEVDVEDLARLAELTDHVVDLFARIVQHFGDRALAEVESVVGARHGFDEALEPLDGTEDAVDAAVALAGRQGGVVRVAAEPHLALLRDRDDALEEVRYAVPHLLVRGRRPVEAAARP